MMTSLPATSRPRPRPGRGRRTDRRTCTGRSRRIGRRTRARLPRPSAATPTGARPPRTAPRRGAGRATRRSRDHREPTVCCRSRALTAAPTEGPRSSNFRDRRQKGATAQLSWEDTRHEQVDPASELGGNRSGEKTSDWCPGVRAARGWIFLGGARDRGPMRTYERVVVDSGST